MIKVGTQVSPSALAIALCRNNVNYYITGYVERCLSKDMFFVAWYVHGQIYAHGIEHILDIKETG